MQQFLRSPSQKKKKENCTSADAAGLLIFAFSAIHSIKFVMYCLQWLLPMLLIPKNLLVHPTFVIDQVIFFWVYMLTFFIERRPCYSCTLIFLVAVSFLCYSDSDRCIFWPACKTVFNGEMCKYVFDQTESSEIEA